MVDTPSVSEQLNEQLDDLILEDASKQNELLRLLTHREITPIEFQERQKTWTEEYRQRHTAIVNDKLP